MPFPEQLLDQALILARIDKTRPRQASLRRRTTPCSIQTLAAAENWKKPAQRVALARAFDHRRMKAACDRMRGRQFPQSSPGSGVHLKKIASTFVDLQELRHLADYDHSKVRTRTEVIEEIDLVPLAFESWKAIQGEAIADEFLLQLLIQR